jgi:hypothetical protein
MEGGHAWLFENSGPIVDLNTLVPRGSNLTLELAESINDRGEIAGIGSPPGCENPFACGHVFVLIPCDESHFNTKGCVDGDETTKTADENRAASAAQASTATTQSDLTPGETKDRIRAWLSSRRFRSLPQKQP